MEQKNKAKTKQKKAKKTKAIAPRRPLVVVPRCSTCGLDGLSVYKTGPRIRYLKCRYCGGNQHQFIPVRQPAGETEGEQEKPQSPVDP